MLKKLCVRLSSRSKRGFTLIEVMIVVAILAILILALLTSVTKERIKAEDARIKSDLERLRIAFEEYYNDNNCYPPAEWFEDANDCGSENLKPYLNVIPCNPKTALPYVLEDDYDTTKCSSFKIYSSLANLYDTSLTTFCVPSGGSTKGNYGVSSTNVVIATDCSGLPSPTPSPSLSPIPSNDPTFPWACQNTGCDNFGAPNSCPINFPNSSPGVAQCVLYCSTSPVNMRCN